MRISSDDGFKEPSNRQIIGKIYNRLSMIKNKVNATLYTENM
ncbi:hypothetical protein BCBMB205_27030 [Bacillus sp. CN2]|nr:hypothetical protein BCBMB205_27030 [Bacillus velezensis]ARZ59047.1 hypothetical protein BAGQ_2817 [Bacillus velezensis]GFR55671.1 hypothetical protein BCBMB205_27030 [Bacillus sp. CN2]